MGAPTGVYPPLPCRSRPTTRGSTGVEDPLYRAGPGSTPRVREPPTVMLAAGQGADVGVTGDADAIPASGAVSVGAVPPGSAALRVSASARWRPAADVRGLQE
jgi:hypothetical protein